ncbi:MAG: hypothetical protein KBC41_01885 [Candidatus Pacebacteria bacterium]|nr:hypothetical protein [Candidatus Paceibacterota bacterium]
MTTLESLPENKTETRDKKQAQKLSPKEQDEKYLVESPETKNIETPQINLERMPKAEYYWHGTLTGEGGGIIDSILANGLKPKEKLDIKNIGNDNTPDGAGVFVADSGAGMINYLKNAVGYNSKIGGLPTFVSVKVEKRDTEYSYDTDILAENQNEDTYRKDNLLCWFSLALSYNTVDEFLNDKMTQSVGIQLQNSVKGLSGLTISEAKETIWKNLNSFENVPFMQGGQLARFLKNVDVKRWDKTLMILNKINGKKGHTGNLVKKNGWEADELKRVYVVTPDGDKDWKKWAKLIPPEIANKWDEWGTLKDKEGNPIPGNGRMIRIK